MGSKVVIPKAKATREPAPDPLLVQQAHHYS